MGINVLSKVMPAGCARTVLGVVTLAVVCSWAASLQCPPGVQYWDSALDSCFNCTKCGDLTPKGQVVLRPCEVHRDTICSPISELRLDWSWLTPRQPKPHHKHQHQHHHHHHHGEGREHPHHSHEDGGSGGDVRSSYEHSAGPAAGGEAASRGQHRQHKPKQQRQRVVWHFAKPDGGGGADQLADTLHSEERDKVRGADYVMNENEDNLVSPALADVTDARDVVNERLVWPANDDDVPFSSAETLVWDWQAVVLAMAVCACILFFVVAAVYSVHHARQWKRLKENFEADVEELSARLNLMVASGDVNETLEPNLNSPINDGNYHNNHCVYLEQLLVKKDAKMEPKRVGNVYIEDKNAANNNGNIVTTEKINND